MGKYCVCEANEKNIGEELIEPLLDFQHLLQQDIPFF